MIGVSEPWVQTYAGVVMSGEDAPRPYLENLIVPEIKTNKQYAGVVMSGEDAPRPYLDNLIVREKPPTNMNPMNDTT